MSEFQCVCFRAVDRPLNEQQMEYMEKQSSRAEFTRWDYQVEYNYSSFRGDVEGMLRNGYDICIDYYNYGSTRVHIRLPHGLPIPKATLKNYLDNGISWTADKSGKSGFLTVAVSFEGCYYRQWEINDCLDALAKLRELLMAGDLRALYTLWLCSTVDMNCDIEEQVEPPTPHGLSQMDKSIGAIFGLFEMDELIIHAAASDVPELVHQSDVEDPVHLFVQQMSSTRQAAILTQMLTGDALELKQQLLGELRDSCGPTTSPVTEKGRTVNELLTLTDALRELVNERDRKAEAAKAKREAVKAEKERRARMELMKKAPESWLEKASKLVESRGSENYIAAATLLADLREAVGGDEGETLACKHALRLTKKYPTLNMLKSALRKQQLIS
ncbi:MAG: hypothetical protein U0930_07890 [Pirellulales bacterium]